MRRYILTCVAIRLPASTLGGYLICNNVRRSHSVLFVLHKRHRVGPCHRAVASLTSDMRVER